MSASEQIQESFTIGDAPRLSLSNVKGSITIHGEERSDIQVTAVKQTQGEQDPGRTEIHTSQEQDSIVVKTVYHNEDDGWLKRLRDDRVCAVDYVISLPHACDLDISQVQGNIQVESVSGQVKVNAVQGLVELSKISGRTKVHGVNANIKGHAWTGRADLHTVSGSVQLHTANLSRIKANTVSGDLVLESDDRLAQDGRYDFNSVSGDVFFYLPADQGLESRGSTLSGKLKCDLPHEFSKRRRSGWRATVNQGGPAVRFNSVSGDLHLRQHAPAAA